MTRRALFVRVVSRSSWRMCATRQHVPWCSSTRSPYGGVMPAAMTSLALLGLGHCRLATGDTRGATALLEQALVLARELPSTLWHVPMVELTLARALGRGDVARARTLATQARDGFARFPGLGHDRAAAEALIAML